MSDIVTKAVDTVDPVQVPEVDVKALQVHHYHLYVMVIK